MIVPRIVAIASMLVSMSACAASNSPTFVHDGAAIRGYDTVAYHLESRPVKGSSEYTHEYNGALWRFSSRENLDLFRADPDRYAPQYGGFCAYGMSKGYAVSTDPNAWAVKNGKLYLNYSVPVQKTWLKDVPGNIAKANVNWDDMISKPGFEQAD